VPTEESPFPKLNFTPLNRKYDEKFAFEMTYNNKTVPITPPTGDVLHFVVLFWFGLVCLQFISFFFAVLLFGDSQALRGARQGGHPSLACPMSLDC
jgi:hypothetical protein